MSDHSDRQTTEKLDVRRALFLERLVRVWDKVPNLRLGELIVLSFDMTGVFDIEVLKNIDDVDLVERIERWALHRKSE